MKGLGDGMTVGKGLLCFLIGLHVAVLCLVCGGCAESGNEQESPLVLYDFEHDSQLDNLSWKCGTVYQRVKEHGSSGSYSLMVEMYPGVEWPGFGFGVKDGWEGYSTLSLYIFNPAAEPVTLTCRIDDRKDDPPYADRVNRRITLEPGGNLVTFDLRELWTSGTNRRLNLEDICCFLLFMHRLDHRVVIYLDDITLR